MNLKSVTWDTVGLAVQWKGNMEEGKRGWLYTVGQCEEEELAWLYIVVQWGGKKRG